MSEILAAVLAGVVAIVVAGLASRRDTRRQADQLRHEIALQEERIRAELRTEYMAEAALHQMLVQAEPKRSCNKIKARVGGFDDDELRRLLVRAGALRYMSNDGKTELWGLRDRNTA